MGGVLLPPALVWVNKDWPLRSASRSGGRTSDVYSGTERRQQGSSLAGNPLLLNEGAKLAPIGAGRSLLEGLEVWVTPKPPFFFIL